MSDLSLTSMSLGGLCSAVPIFSRKLLPILIKTYTLLHQAIQRVQAVLGFGVFTNSVYLAEWWLKGDSTLVQDTINRALKQIPDGSTLLLPPREMTVARAAHQSVKWCKLRASIRSESSQWNSKCDPILTSQTLRLRYGFTLLT